MKQKTSDAIKTAGIIIPIISGILAVINLINQDTGVKAIVITISLAFFITGMSFRKSLRVLFILLSALCFLNFFVFPAIYSRILNEDPLAFEFPQETLSREQQESLEEFKATIDTINLSAHLITLKEVLADSLDRLTMDIEIDSLKNDLLILKHGYLGLGQAWNFRGRDGGYRPNGRTLRVFDLKGKMICGFDLQRLGDLESGFYFGTVLQRMNRELKETKSSIEAVKDEEFDIVENKRFWTYRKFLRYSLSMLTEGHIEPISRKANFWYPVHKLTVGFFLLNAIFTVFFMVISAGKSDPDPTSEEND